MHISCSTLCTLLDEEASNLEDNEEIIYLDKSVDGSIVISGTTNWPKLKRKEVSS